MSEWISVKDRLPEREDFDERSDYVLIAYENTFSEKTVWVGWYQAEGWKLLGNEGNDNYLDSVTHWQPLPAPPQVPDA